MKFEPTMKPGIVRIIAIQPPTAAGHPPPGYAIFENNVVDVDITEELRGDVLVRAEVPHVDDAELFRRLRLLHFEGGVFVDRTLLGTDDPPSDFGTRAVYARTQTLGPFMLAVLTPGAFLTPHAR